MTAPAWIAVLGAIAIASSCASRAGAVQSASMEETMRLQVGQTATAASGALQIVFEAVEGDSRCPKGEACIWEGDAIVLLAVRAPGKSPGRLALHTASKGPAAAAHEGWSIRLVTLEPYPVTGRAIETAEYVATLSVTLEDAK